LLAKASAQSTSLQLTHRYREQARSHRGWRCARSFGSPQDRPCGRCPDEKLTRARGWKRPGQPGQGGLISLPSDHHTPLVGAGLLAKASAQSTSLQLTRRYREQARSHRGWRCAWSFGSPQDRPCGRCPDEKLTISRGWKLPGQPGQGGLISLPSDPPPLWERACSRKRQPSQHRCN